MEQDNQEDGRSEGLAEARLSEELRGLQGHFAGQELSLGEIVSHLKGRAYLLLIILLSLPFLSPLPLPGLSTPFGALIALVALRLSFGQKPWIPQWIQRRRVPQNLLLRVLAVTTRIIGWLERLLRPRHAWAVEGALPRAAHCLLIFVAALVLLLPLPIPLTNTFPAWVILLAAGGLLERDGLASLAAYVVFALGTLYFIFLGEAASRLVEALMAWLRG
jgi:hypothetical protein